MERLLARPVAGAEQAAGLAIPNGESELARQPLEHRRAPAAEGLQQHLGIRLGAEPNALALQLASNRLVVVDLAVEGDRQPPVGGEERLVRPGIEVDDREAAVPQR